MSLILLDRIDLLKGSVLNIYDSTGTYNASTNTTGWNSPNPSRSGITSATLSIYLPNVTTAAVTTDVTSIVQAAATEEFLLKSYTISDLGLTGTILADGIYRMVYTVISGGNTYTSDQYFLSYYNVKCCVVNKFATFVSETCTCKSTDTLLTQWVTLKALMFSVAGGNLTEANTILTRLQRMCNTTKCC